MKIIRDIQKYNSSKSVVLAIGNFDGVHLGHQKLLRYVVSQARKYKSVPAVLTFPKHPQGILHPNKKLPQIISLETKLRYLEKAGIKICFLPNFSKVFSKLSPEKFVREILIKKLHIEEVCMGYDAHFGAGRRGNGDVMRGLARKYGFIFKQMPAVILNGKPVSSSCIRKWLLKGELLKVQKVLGRKYSVAGKVVHGRHIAAGMAVSTANIETDTETLLPLGIYAARGRILDANKKKYGKWLNAVLNFGKRPTFPKLDTPSPVLEVHFLNIEKNLYGKTVEVEIHKKLRNEKKFLSQDALRRQIFKDIDKTKEYFAKG